MDCPRERLENPKMGFAYDFTWMELDFMKNKAFIVQIPYVKSSAVWDSNWGSETPRGWGEEAGGRGGSEGGDIYIPIADSC